MTKPSIPADETSRLFALYSLRILGTDPEPAYDIIAGLARQIYKVPFAGISFVDQSEVWLKTTNTSGLVAGTRAFSICGHGILTDEATIINDTTKDERFLNNPYLSGEQTELAGIRAYCGIPIHSPTGHRVGMLCLADTVPRNFSDAELQPLKTIAALVESLLVNRSNVMEAVYLDALTGLPANIALTDQLSLALSRAATAAAGDQRGVSLLKINLDNFRFLNSGFGRSVGDRVIRMMAERLRALIGDRCMLFKEAGDNFYVLCEGANDADIADLAQDIKARIAEPFLESGEPLELTASIGIVHTVKGGISASELMTMAQFALHDAKKRGRDVVSIYEQPADDSRLQQFEIYSDLKKALSNQELELYYQPTIQVDTGRILAMEALLRWKHPRLGLMYPADFIELAETTGLIVQIGEWVVQEACLQAQNWRRDGLEAFVVSVNASAVQFERGDLCSVIDDALKLSGLPPHYLEIELTESILVSENNISREIIEVLNQMGVRLAIDDFGTGYSNLSYLRKIAFDKIKIDQSFIRQMGESKESFVFVKVIKQLADSMGIEVVAEGVETEAQLAILREVGIGEVQGYLFARPAPWDIKQLIDVGRVKSRAASPATGKTGAVAVRGGVVRLPVI